MRTKKILLIVVGTLAALTLLVALLVGAIAGAIFYTLGKSEAAETARVFLRRSERLQRDIGEVRDFGYIITGSVNTSGADGTATLNLKVVGARRSANASVDLMYHQGREWRVTGASYRNESGQTVELLDKYGPDETEQTPPLEDEDGATQEEDGALRRDDGRAAPPSNANSGNRRRDDR
ncbi:MAG TPA: cytochrome c oxidase assembly factor Coa1 family protein [Pyrinomonadaceae bacterium]|jgi:hypothetical protein|nr:cytochrome c oxidase assembly factor Coa1 family protein [Pyrinomonadaceae bacterium]